MGRRRFALPPPRKDSLVISKTPLRCTFHHCLCPFVLILQFPGRIPTEREAVLQKLRDSQVVLIDLHERF